MNFKFIHLDQRLLFMLILNNIQEILESKRLSSHQSGLKVPPITGERNFRHLYFYQTMRVILNFLTGR
jgi:hypothetical protein